MLRVSIFVTFWLCFPLLHADEEEKKKADAKVEKAPQSGGTRYLLTDGESELIVLADWKVHRGAYDGCIGVLSTDVAKTHSHHVVLVGAEELKGVSVLDFAKARFKGVTEGDDVVEESKWMSAPSGGGIAHRKVAQDRV